MRTFLVSLILAILASPARADWRVYQSNGLLRISSTNAVNDAFTFNNSGQITSTSLNASSITATGYMTGPVGVSDSGSTIDFSKGNAHYTTQNCGSFALWNIKDGGNYMFVVQGAMSTLCSFTGFSDAGSTALTVHPPPDLGVTTASKHTVFNIAVVGTHAYIAWTPGY